MFKNNLFEIVYEDEDILLINKNYNVIVSSKYNNENNNIYNNIIKYIPNIINIENRGIVNRLDKDTTGLLILAKNNNSYFKLKKDFKDRKVYKKYIAIVSGEILTGGIINNFISRCKNNRTKMCINNIGKKSITTYKIKKKLYLHTCLYIMPKTGRTHQIRLHMSNIGNPIIGDNKYKNNSSNFKKSLFFIKKNKINILRQALHSYKLIFNHPNKNKLLKIKCTIPKDILYLMDVLSIKKNI